MHQNASVFALLNTAQEAIRKAGNILLQGFERTDREKPVYKYKEDGSIVTSTDLQVEKILIESILKRYETHSFLTEEHGKIGKSPYCWIIDPIDGTNNFIKQIPILSISMALYFHGKPLLGLVYQPFTDELFTAIDGHGSQLNGNRIRINTVKNNPILTFSQSSLKKKNMQILIDQKADEKFTHIRALGSIALELAYLASGKIEVAGSENIWIWNIAAGALLVEEARGLLEVNMSQENPNQVISIQAFASQKIKDLF